MASVNIADRQLIQWKKSLLLTEKDEVAEYLEQAPQIDSHEADQECLILRTWSELLLRDHKSAVKNLKSLETRFPQLDDPGKFYFYFLSGFLAYNEQKFEDSLTYYKQAQGFMCRLPYEEQAYYHYKVASSYYMLKQSFYSLDHCKQALEIYEKIGSEYKQRIAHTKNIQALNYVDLSYYEQAEVELIFARDAAEKYNDDALKVATYRNIGLFYTEQKLYKIAVNYYLKVINVNSFKKTASEDYLETLWNLAEAYFELNENNKAQNWIIKGKEMAATLEKNIVLQRFELLDAINNGGPDDTFYEGIACLEKYQLWSDIIFLAKNIGEIFWDRSNYEKAAYFYRKSNFAREKIKETEVLH